MEPIRGREYGTGCGPIGSLELGYGGGLDMEWKM
jgi:hypothetical protein